MDTDKTIKQEKPVSAKKSVKRDYVYAVGRQREAVARVRIYPHVKEGLKWGETVVNKDQMLVNGLPIEHYFSGAVSKTMYIKPFKVTDTLNKYAVTVKVEGGGNNGQLDAMIQGVARALSILDTKKFRPILKQNGFLTRDARVRQRRKVGTGGKARRKKQSPKR